MRTLTTVAALVALAVAGCTAQAVEDIETAEVEIVETAEVVVASVIVPEGDIALDSPTLTAEAPAEVAPAEILAAEAPAEVAPAEVVCHEDEECWDWRTMGGHDAGATVTIFDGEVMSGVITDNGDGTYTFVPKS